MAGELSRHIADIRQDFRLAELEADSLGEDPLAAFRRWFSEAEAAQIDEVNAMTLATADATGRPHARIVLLKGLDEAGFVFYTNYDSAKGHELAQNPQAALVFFWKELQRQVRVEGFVSIVSEGESDDYFASRPAGSRVGAWASPQSRTIADRESLEAAALHYTGKFGDGEIPRPPHWGGYQLTPVRIEFWQGRSSRLHDRIVFDRGGTGGWSRSRLAP